MESTRTDHLIAWMAALAITIHVLESALPTPLPGVKPGLANIITLAAMLLWGWRVAAWISLLRVLVGSLFIGTFLTPTFFLSFSGACCSLLVLGVAYIGSEKIPALAPTAVGYGVLAALAHMLGQFLAAYWLFIPHAALFRLLPILMTAALIFGILSGVITARLVANLNSKDKSISKILS